MGSLNSLFASSQNEVMVSRVIGYGSSGEFKVSISGVIHRVNSAISENIKIGETALLNKTPYGKYYISGIASGLGGNSNNIMEINKDG